MYFDDEFFELLGENFNIFKEKKEKQPLSTGDIFVNQLISCLKTNHIKRDELAKEIGISPDTFYAWTSTKKRPHWIDPMSKLFSYLITHIDDFDPISLFFDEVDFEKVKEERDTYKKNLSKIKKVMTYKSFTALKPYIGKSSFLAKKEQQELIPLLTSKTFCDCVAKMKDIENNQNKMSYKERDDARKELQRELYDAIRDMLKIKTYRFYLF